MGVPTDIKRSSLRIDEFTMRTQPCETAPGMIWGRLVPCTPTKPPPGQSVRTAERALVPKATGP